MPERPTLRQLEYLVALAETLHFGKAAKRCAVSQPALSSQIQHLEELVGAQLFERSGRRTMLTPLGSRLAARARAILRDADELMEVAGAAGTGLQGEVRMGVIPTVAPYLLPALLPAVREAWPKLRLLLREDQTHRLVDRLREGGLDLLLLALPVDGDDLAQLPLMEEPFILAAPRGHPLARKGPVSDADLDGAEVLLLEEGHCLRDQALSVCRLAGASETADVRATSLGTLVQMVQGGLGVTLLPATAAAVEVREETIVLRKFRRPEPTRMLGLVWRKSSARGEAYASLGQTLREAAGDLPLRILAGEAGTPYEVKGP
jgi:LysR family transcriptional regulator, hydrogen peroxide-inducible genes activator